MLSPPSKASVTCARPPRWYPRPVAAITFSAEPKSDESGALEVVPVVDGILFTDRVHAFERSAQMEPREAYAGLFPESFRFESARLHYTASGGMFVRKLGCAPLLGCSCGEWGCWPLWANIAVSCAEVRWSDFEQPYRPDRDYSAFGPFVFARGEYDAALAALSEVWDPAVARI